MTLARKYWSQQGKNFMTPNVIEYIDTPRFLVEFAEGEGFDHEPIYGVSVATREGERVVPSPGSEAWDGLDRTPYSRMFHDEEEARDYIETVLF